jgi:hypothetical protein
MTGYDWSQLKGFNYQPGYAPNMQFMWTHFDREAWKREVPWSLRFGANTLRVWLDWGAYLAIGEAMLDNLEDALGILDENDLRMIPVLFNRWVDPRYPGGGVSDNDLRCSGWGLEKFDAYVGALAKRFASEERILLWDVCNEPMGGDFWNDPAILFREHVWLSNVADKLRRETAIPVTVGAMTYDYVLQAAALCDVISFHPYTVQIGEMEKLCSDHLAIAERFGKPLICTETCKGSFDDQERGALARNCIETLERHGIGWLAWHLCESRFVTGSRGRTDSNSIHPNQGYMPFVLADGATRPGHEWLERRKG